jgi:hypothetical protein
MPPALILVRGQAFMRAGRTKGHDMIVATTTKQTTWQHFQARFAEWQNATILTIWGSYVILHPGMFVAPKSGAIFIGLISVASQETWGMMALLVGVCRAAALYINGKHARTPAIRLISSFFSAFIITQIFVGLLNSGTPTTGLAVYPVLILADIYSAFRASADMTFVARQGLEMSDSAESRSVLNNTQRA